MSVQCPHCGFVMNVKGARPGRFTPTCTKCQHKFSLTVSGDPSIAPLATTLEAAPKGPVGNALDAELARALEGDAPARRVASATATAPGPMPHRKSVPRKPVVPGKGLRETDLVVKQPQNDDEGPSKKSRGVGHIDRDDKAKKKEWKKESYLQRRYGGVSGLLLGQQARLVLALLLLAGFGMWLYKTKAQSALNEGRALTADSVDPVDIVASGNISTGKVQVKDRDLKEDSKKGLEIDATNKITNSAKAPDAVRQTAQTIDANKSAISKMLGSWNTGAAAGILLLGAMFRGKVLGAVVIACAAIILVGAILQSPIFGYDPTKALLIAGTVVALVSIYFLRDLQAPG